MLHDASAIASGDAEELQRLAEGVLGCAVQCEEKARHIQSIMTLDKASQQDMMVLTQRVLMRGEENALDTQSSWAGDNTQDESLFSEAGGAALVGADSELAEAKEAARRLQARVYELEGAAKGLEVQLSAAEARSTALGQDLEEAVVEKRTMEKKYNDAVEQSMGGGGGGGQHNGALAQLEVRVAEQENVIAVLRVEVANKAGLEAQNMRAADDLQMQSTRCEELEKEVSRLKGFQAKLEQAGDLRKRLQEKEQELDKMLEQARPLAPVQPIAVQRVLHEIRCSKLMLEKHATCGRCAAS